MCGELRAQHRTPGAQPPVGGRADQADQAVKAGVPAKFAWSAAFGLALSLVWLYIEILRLLTYFNSD